MNLKEWIHTHSYIDQIQKFQKGKQKTSKIYNVSNYFIKQLEKPDEYLIANDLSGLNLEFFPKTKHLLTSDESMDQILGKEIYPKKPKKTRYYMITQKIEGKSFYEMLHQVDLSDFKQIIQAILYGLSIAWEKYKFVHGDLHLSNIILQPLQSPIYYDPPTNPFPHPIFELNQPIRLEKYAPVIIDFEHSQMNCSTKTIVHDAWKLLGCLQMYLTDEKGEYVLDCIEKFIDRFEFQERKDQFALEWFQNLP
jgi:serine/threonine protein kinase